MLSRAIGWVKAIMFLFLPLFLVGVLPLQYPIIFATVASINPNSPPSTLLQHMALNSSAPITYNVLSLGGWTSTKGLSGPAQFWAAPSKYLHTERFGQSDTDVQSSLKKIYQLKGIRVLVSAFSDREFPLFLQLDPAATATSLADFVAKNNLDGACVELSGRGGLANLTNSDWILAFTRTLRNKLGSKILAYQQLPTDFVSGMAFFPILGSLMLLIDFVVVKYHDMQQPDYSNYSSLMLQSSVYQGSSVKQLVRAGLLPNQIVVGKPASNLDGTSMFVSGDALQSAFQSAFNELGWYGGYANPDLFYDLNGTFAQTATLELRKLCSLSGRCI